MDEPVEGTADHIGEQVDEEGDPIHPGEVSSALELVSIKLQVADVYRKRHTLAMALALAVPARPPHLATISSNPSVEANPFPGANQAEKT